MLWVYCFNEFNSHLFANILINHYLISRYRDTEGRCTKKSLNLIYSHLLYWFPPFQSLRNSMLPENLNLWIFMWMKLNIAWRCTCPTFLKSSKGRYFVNMSFSNFFGTKVSSLHVLTFSCFLCWFDRHTVKVVPILVGALSPQSEAMYGQLLSKYVDDPKNFFSVSSDFCHWGSR